MRRVYCFICSVYLLVGQIAIAQVQGNNPEVAPSNKIIQAKQWTNLEVPVVLQTSQIDAGYPMGCEITAILYTLKFGPYKYKKSYEEIPGSSDLEKIHYLVSKFSAMQSKDNPNQPAFSEKYGTNPNDVPWMFQSLVTGSEPLESTTYLAPKTNQTSESNKMLEDLYQKGLKNISVGKPILVQLLYLNPSFSHAVVITGIEQKIYSDSNLNLRILDPMTGNESVANVTVGPVKFGDNDLVGLEFSDLDVTSQSGTLLSIEF